MIYPKIAVIDQGVDKDFRRLRNCELEEVVIQSSQKNKQNENVSGSDLNIYHGTTIASLIHSVVPRVPILSVKLISDKKVTVNLLIKALRYLKKRNDVDIINISLGILTDNPSKELEESCLACYNEGKIIVAAAHYNSSKECFPAAFSCVYGVGTGIVRNVDDYEYIGPGYINILAKGIHQRVFNCRENFKISEGTSFASAAFSAICAKLLMRISDFSHKIFLEHVKSKSSSVPPVHELDYEENEEPEYSNGPVNLKELAKIGMLYPADESAVQPMSLHLNNVKLAMMYPMDPLKEFTYNKRSSSKFIRGIISPKIFNQVNTLLLGNFIKNKFLINIYFGYALIDLFICHGGDIVVFEPSVLKIIKNKYSSFSCQSRVYLYR